MQLIAEAYDLIRTGTGKTPAEIAALFDAGGPHEVAETLGLEHASEVAPDQIFRDIGMDSLMSADFAQRLQKRLGIRSTALVFEHPTAARLAAHLIATLRLTESPVVVVEEPVAALAGAAAVAGTTAATPMGLPALAAIGTTRADTGRTELYAPEVEAEVLAFQRIAYPSRDEALIVPRWRWMFLESARRLNRTPQVWLHRQEGRIVGHNGAIPVRLKIGDVERETAWLVDTMVLPEYRGHAVGARLMVEAHEDLPFALSLGQTQQMREIQLRLGWKQVAPLAIAQMLIRPERVLQSKLAKPAAVAAGLALRAGNAVRGAIKGRADAAVKEISRFDESHDRLWTTMAVEVPCVVRRDASYLNWKYVDQPGQNFVRLEVSAPNGQRGVVILMFREPDGAYQYGRAFIVDLVAPLHDETLMSYLLSAAVRAAGDRGADSLLCLHINGSLSSVLQREGFWMRPPTRYLLVRPDGLDDSLRDRLLDPAAWLVTQGDSDIDRPW